MHYQIVDREFPEDTNEKLVTETIPRCRGMGSTTGTHENINCVVLSKLTIHIYNFQREITPQTKYFGRRCSTSTIHCGDGATPTSADTKSKEICD